MFLNKLPFHRFREGWLLSPSEFDFWTRIGAKKGFENKLYDIIGTAWGWKQVSKQQSPMGKRSILVTVIILDITEPFRASPAFVVNWSMGLCENPQWLTAGVNGPTRLDYCTCGLITSQHSRNAVMSTKSPIKITMMAVINRRKVMNGTPRHFCTEPGWMFMNSYGAVVLAAINISYLKLNARKLFKSTKPGYLFWYFIALIHSPSPR